MGPRLSDEASRPGVVRHRVEGAGALWIEWDDGHQTSIDPSRLRSACPCAQCRETREARIRGRLDGSPKTCSGDAPEPGSWPPGSMQLVSVAPVGRYGLTPTWGDGHCTGIYTWEMLHGLCDCYACRLARDGA